MNFFFKRGANLLSGLKSSWRSLPSVWLILWMVLPLLIIFSISLAQFDMGFPPFRSIVHWVSPYTLELSLTVANYVYLFSSTLHVHAFWSSFQFALMTTAICALMSYIMSYAILSFPSQKVRLSFLMLIGLPALISSLIRLYALRTLLAPQGFLSVLIRDYFNIPLVSCLGSNISVIFGMVYIYLPFLFFPLYISLNTIAPVYREAALDLGAKPKSVFWKVTFPLSLPGLKQGALMVFIPAFGDFVIPELLGNDKTLALGRLLWYEFFYTRDWPSACSLAMSMLTLIWIPVWFFEIRSHDRNKEVIQ